MIIHESAKSQVTEAKRGQGSTCGEDELSQKTGTRGLWQGLPWEERNVVGCPGPTPFSYSINLIPFIRKTPQTKQLLMIWLLVSVWILEKNANISILVPVAIIFAP